MNGLMRILQATLKSSTRSFSKLSQSWLQAKATSPQFINGTKSARMPTFLTTIFWAAGFMLFPTYRWDHAMNTKKLTRKIKQSRKFGKFQV